MFNIVIILFLCLTLSSLLLKILFSALLTKQKPLRIEMLKLAITNISTVFLKKIVPTQIKSEQQKTGLLRFLRNHESATQCIFFFFAKLFSVCVSYFYCDIAR